MGNLHASSCGEPKWGRGYFEQASELAREEERERRREREKKREEEEEERRRKERERLAPVAPPFF